MAETALCIALIGDSITARPGSWGWREYEGAQIENIAVGGSTVSSWNSWAYEEQWPKLTCEPDIVHIMSGGNEASEQLQVSAGLFALFLGGLLDQVARDAPDATIWLSYPPRVWNVNSTMAAQRRLGDYDEVIAAILADGVAELGIDCRSLDLWPSRFIDGVHPNAEGNDVLAEAFQERIIEAVPEPDAAVSAVLGAGIIAGMRKRRRRA